MPATLQIAKISCRGGLDLRANSQELLGKPGFAQQLENFECENRGGYRRINGYQPFGTNVVPGSGTIKGIQIFNDSILVARGDDLYHTFDTITWVQINKVVTGADHATIVAASATALDTNATEVNIIPYSHGTTNEEQIVTIVNGYDDVMVFKITGTDHTNATYTFSFLDEGLTGAPSGASFGFAFKDQVYLSGEANRPSSVFYSALTDPESYTGTNSGEIGLADPVVGMMPFRDVMVFFCEDSLHSFKDANVGNPVRSAITTDIGCISGDSIQEINGDLIYLAPDGLRTIAGTDKIDDVELSSVSSNVNPLLNTIIDNIDNFSPCSVVLREKNQYRIYFPNTVSALNTKGVIGSLVYGQSGIEWNWSTTKGINARVVTEGLYDNDYISLMALDDGVLYQHDAGNTFDGERIQGTYISPFFDLGDPSIRKNIHRVRTYIKPDGAADVFMNLKYTGYGNETPQSPQRYSLGELRTPAIYGEAEYGTNYTYGARIIDNKVTNTEGSGFTISVQYFNNSTDAPYNIQGFDLDYIASGKV